MNLDLDLLAAPYAVCRLAPARRRRLGRRGRISFRSPGRPKSSRSFAPRNESPTGSAAERDFRVLKIRGPLDFSLVGVLSGLIGPLAAAGISMFALSTFDTDYILVKQEHLGRAAEILIREGHNILGA